MRKHQEPEVKIPAVVAPIGGESYNPSAKDFVEMVDKIIEIETKKPTERQPKKIKKIRKIVPRARNLKKRAEQLQAIERRLERRQRHA